ncbi:alkylation response protein AidB-like acyl-CoA dehydrogenase [Saccharothrix saharensis]|uniref:Alkylation response protein AidB-like acyl-CoA dehydrogenase n=1 Tax=Saccharothrix saharensis TaxID=571190 RepID=A0A543J876_9PSEU|nr:acyl-CoA dehydrogenase family protein [Saccharothrix saharensis]TQM79027.1 alkylation response protein AidB-like acyl-CoA dehydrogenase [Saccharothrix saharensis]
MGLRQEVRAFARTHLLDGPADLAARTAAWHAAGLANWWLPVEHGGRGLSLVEGVDVVDELAYADAGFAFSSLVGVIGSTLVDLYGDDRLRADVLGALGRDGGFFATAVTERDAGSELDRMATTAVPKGDSVVLTGEKLFSTNADHARYLLVVARHEAGADEQPHVAVVVPRDAAGVAVSEPWRTMGLTGSPVHRVSLSDCAVPAGHVLDGHGLRLLEVGLNASRVLIAATAVGLSRRVRDLCLDFAGGRRLRDGVLAKHPLFADKMAQVEIEIETMRSQCRAAAAEFDAVRADPDAARRFARRGALKSALVAKVFCGQAGWRVAGTGSEVFGGLGYTDELPIGALMRDLRHVSLVEGGEDVLRDVVYRRFTAPPVRRA